MNKSSNIWQYKPWWCQPWSILLTGISIIAISWLSLKIFWVTILVAMVILAWWFYFLILYPQFLRDSGLLAEFESQQRQNNQSQ